MHGGGGGKEEHGSGPLSSSRQGHRAVTPSTPLALKLTTMVYNPPSPLRNSWILPCGDNDSNTRIMKVTEAVTVSKAVTEMVTLIVTDSEVKRKSGNNGENDSDSVHNRNWGVGNDVQLFLQERE